MKTTITSLCVLAVALVSGCARDQHPVRNPDDVAELEQLRLQAASLEREIEALEQQTAYLAALAGNRQLELEDLRALSERYRVELENLQQLAELSGSESDGLRQLAEQRAREIAELRRQIDERTALFERLRRRLSRLIDSGQLTMGFRRGFIVIQLPNQILFRSGRADLSEQGMETLEAVGEVVSEITDRRFLVGGHTDNVPIRQSGWPSNWHLSSARAQSVLEVLVAAGVQPERIGAAGFGEFDPVASNEAADARARNRRTELLVIPNLEELYRSLQNARSR